MNYEQANAVKHLAPRVMKVLERLEWIEYLKKQKGGIVKKWSWTPQVGEWILPNLILKDNKPELIYKIRDSVWVDVTNHDKLNPKYFTPILEWEEIERVLEKAGYWVKVERVGHQVCRAMIGKYMKDYQMENWIEGRDYIEAVYKAVLIFGKELKKC